MKQPGLAAAAPPGVVSRGDDMSYRTDAYDPGGVNPQPPANSQVPRPIVLCFNCGLQNAAGERACFSCGAELPHIGLESASAGGASSSGRQPMTDLSDTSPAGRRAYLLSIMPPGGPSLLRQIGQAERAVELCEADHADAETVVRGIQAQMPEMPEARARSAGWDEQTRSLVEACGHHRSTGDALAEAKRNLYSLLAAYDRELGNTEEARYHETLASEQSGPWHL
jgi:hypothetical protein